MASIKEQLDILIQLQKIDTRRYALKEELNEKPKGIESLREKFQSKENSLKQLEEKLKNYKLKLKEMELELKTKEESVKKMQIQLYQVKTNKEYASLQKEIEGLKADNSLLEEEIIKYLDEIDALGKQLNREKDLLSQEKNKIEAEVSLIENKINALKEELKTIESERNNIASHVEPSLLAKYERILVNKSGRALATVLNDSCSGCNIELPPQVINEIRLGEKMVTCDNCLRILYIGI